MKKNLFMQNNNILIKKDNENPGNSSKGLYN